MVPLAPFLKVWSDWPRAKNKKISISAINYDDGTFRSTFLKANKITIHPWDPQFKHFSDLAENWDWNILAGHVISWPTFTCQAQVSWYFLLWNPKKLLISNHLITKLFSLIYKWAYFLRIGKALSKSARYFFRNFTQKWSTFRCYFMIKRHFWDHLCTLIRDLQYSNSPSWILTIPEDTYEVDSILCIM